MSEQITIINNKNVGPSKFSGALIGENTKSFVNSLIHISEDGKYVVIDEASHILKKCIKPGVNDSITNIAVGYIQSGKTLSYTTLTSLAADNGFRIIIYLTGVTTSLGNQTHGRIQRDLVNNSETYMIFSDKTKYGMDDCEEIFNHLKYGKDSVLLFPIMKHYRHIWALTKLFHYKPLKPYLAKTGVLIIDDEADQASFNTYAKRNASKPDWEDDDTSKTYASILNLRKVFPSLSYVQYTATPQAAFLIDSNDILSPKYHVVLSPGNGYVGGKIFFETKEQELVREIPPEEVYDRSNPLKGRPNSLDESFFQFIVSVAIVVYIEKRENIRFLSMMVHPDGSKDSNEKFYGWIHYVKQMCLEELNLADGDPAKAKTISKFHKAYLEISKYDPNAPAFEKVLPVLVNVLLNSQFHLVQDGSNIDVVPEKEINWNNSKAHILVGANILNRGFTVENLSMTYMPRISKGRATADTIEQRCRFFGYKERYLDVCRVYLPKKSIEEYEAYVKHEEILRGALKETDSLEEFSNRVSALSISDILNATRTNILSKKLIRGKMVGWRQLGSLDYMSENKVTVNNFLQKISGEFIVFNPEQTNLVRKHRYIALDIDNFISFLKEIRFADLPNITRKIVTIQYINYLKTHNDLNYIYVFEMSYSAPVREREFRDGHPVNLMMGHSPKGDLPSDKDFKYEDSITLQIHHVSVKNPDLPQHGKDLYNFAIYYPETFEQSYIAVEQDEEEDVI